ncbi:hypothetical protein BVU17_10605 [Haloarcula taiwanensis]|uniref:Uncharacterized protein n=1 Tax=Haloarcula taiwanensis TaxID=1932004 RepID=A0A2H4ZZR0_9EURY|nr:MULTISPECIES: hypothetical protein [Haloarcula]AUG47945.1 hypothetical protein BVU17_10605 [Haloarcula taiwanensis]RLM39302.1 hypothetical protein DVK01_01715 [Haloarcula sp. Atlit-120R]RLM47201.1 hypothetical protein DVK00_01460 [Haloarcula sp. Atlit-47R]RLM97529.1 hypothetical protein D3D01_06940 [Haloarcula sp. Atlit-7R]
MSHSTDLPDPDPEQLRLAIERLLDETVDRNEPLHLSADELSVSIPMQFGSDAPQATWRFDGDVTVSVDGVRGPLREWVDLVDSRSADTK